MFGLADFEMGVLRVRGDGVSRASWCICRDATVEMKTNEARDSEIPTTQDDDIARVG
jgi:hypothetical protein